MAKRIKKTSKNIQVLVADTLSEQNNIELSELIDLLPSNLQARALRYKSKRSSINFCFGRLMLMRAVSELGFGENKINQVYYSDNDKPLIDCISFSISHSENIVTIAFSTDCELGMDIEKIQKIELKNFKSFFRKDEWEKINSDPNPLQKFYWYWVRKESILKAEDGKMNEVNDVFITSSESGYFKKPENCWLLSEIIIADNYVGVLACDAVNYKLNISPFNSKD